MEKRFDRLEQRVDEIKEDVVELKADFKVHTELVREHVAGDSKIIREITPLIEALPDLKMIVEEYHYDKKLTKEKANKRKELMDKLKIVSLIIAIAGSIYGFFYV